MGSAPRRGQRSNNSSGGQGRKQEGGGRAGQPSQRRARSSERESSERERAGRRATDRGNQSGASRAESRTAYDVVHLSDEIVAELEATARPGKGQILVKVFSEAAGAFAAGDFTEAVRLGDQAKHIALRAASVRELLGLALYRSGQWKEAASELSAFRRLAGTAEQNPVLADCFRALGKPERAVDLCDEIDGRMVSQAVSYEGQVVAAGALRDMGRIDDAIQRLESLDLDPPTVLGHHVRAWYVLADLLETRGRYTQAHDLFEAVAASDADLTDAPQRARRLAPRES